MKYIGTSKTQYHIIFQIVGYSIEAENTHLKFKVGYDINHVKTLSYTIGEGHIGIYYLFVYIIFYFLFNYLSNILLQNSMRQH